MQQSHYNALVHLHQHTAQYVFEAAVFKPHSICNTVIVKHIHYFCLNSICPLCSVPVRYTIEIELAAVLLLVKIQVAVNTNAN